MTHQWVSLHQHTDGSLLDGLGTVQRTVARAKELNFEALALTDHGTLTNAITFTIACEKVGIKPIIGQEIYINHAGKVGHLTILADGQQGFNSLVDLTNHVHKSASSARRPSATLEDLSQFSKGLICLTGCIAAPTHWLDYKPASQFVGDLKSIFDHVYAEMMFVGDRDTWTRPIQLARKLKLELVITNDVHFAYQADAVIHPLLTQMKAAFSYGSSQLWLKTWDEMLTASVPAIGREAATQALEMSTWISKQLSAPQLKHEPNLPSLSSNDGAQLKAKVIAALKIHIPQVPIDLRQTYVDRAKKELALVKELNYTTYFLVLEDIITFAKNNGVLVGPGRGSGVASYLLYLLGVTAIDPIQYGLSLERFMHSKRVGLPDVDIDFDSEGRGRVLEYAIKRWNGVPIATYAHYSHKILVHDLCRTLRLPRDLDHDAADEGVDGHAFKTLCKLDPKFLQGYTALLGQIRHRGKHAGGIVVTKAKVPIERAGNELVAVWTEGEHRELSYAGVVKFDFLGLTALSIFKYLYQATQARPPAPGEDEATLKLFRRGDLNGIFQFSGSPGIRDLTIAVKPTKFMDLVAITALYRPGALDAGTARKYPEWKKHPRKLHPRLDELLKPTYGVIVFQETMMAIFATMTGGGLADADLARQVIVKAKQGDPEWEKKVADLRARFIRDSRRNKFGLETAEQIWEELIAHSRYSFNQSHAVAYTKISWDMAWYKTHHPAEFYAASMMYDTDNLQTYLFEAIKKGIQVHPPDVNYSSARHEVVDGEIYLPITTVKFMAEKGVRAILAERARMGEFKSFADFNARLQRRDVNSRARLGLYAVGGMELKGQPDEAGIDISKIPDASESVVQTMYMGAFLPTKKMVERIEELAHIPNVAVGVVMAKKAKDSHYGPYTVYYLAPNGTFWIRDKDATTVVEVGQFILAKKNGSGKATTIQIMRPL